MDVDRDTDPKRLTGNLVYTIVVVGFCSGFQHGYNTGVLNEIQNVTSTWIRNCDEPSILSDQENCDFSVIETTFIWAQIVSTFCLGGMLGGLSVGMVSYTFGRKYSLIANNIFVFGGGALMFWAKSSQSYGMLIGGRFVIGIAAGLAAGIAPMYLSEISPKSMRGAIGAVYQLAITLTILLSQILGLTSVLGTAESWEYLLLITVIPGLVQVVLLVRNPDSPKYLFIEKADHEAATRALVWLRERRDVTEDLREYAREQDEERAGSESELGPSTLEDLFRIPSLRRPLIISVMLMLAQQLSGINAIVFYSTNVFMGAGLSHDHAQYATLIMGGANVIMTLVAIAVVERFGRKTLILGGLLGMAICTLGLFVCLKINQDAVDLDDQNTTAAFISVLMVMGFVASFAIGPGPIPWFFVSELYTQRARPAANSVAVGVNWAANFLISWSFQPLTAVMGSYVFVGFLALQLAFLSYVWFCVPETKDRTVVEILADFK
eukprot:maker-scaffold336_size202805-snap-gene-1.40 protein:Tk02906 transcript:maker-scaffold336_size202805-snap-gene-1.40-mRNA-1 annotation:"solute carrier family facilitated glucose transporter member 1-like"